MEASTIPPKPQTLPFHPRNIPQSLKDLDQWMLWTWDLQEKKGEKRWTKVPYSPWGQRASCSNASTWVSFQDAYQAYQQGGFEGLSIALAPGDGLVGIDLDKCLDGDNATDKAEEILKQFVGTYTERSPSGNGVRIFCYGKPGRTGKGKDDLWIEIYDATSPRLLTVTGHWMNHAGSYVEHSQEALDWLHETFMFDKEPEQPAQLPVPIDLNDQELLDKARNARNGDKFRRLFDQGDLSDHGGDHSSADLSLCKMLAFWTGRDASRMDRMFRSSGLYRAKWDRADYRDGTIDKAIAQCHKVYEPGKFEAPKPTAEVVVSPDRKLDMKASGKKDWLKANDEGNARAVHYLYSQQFRFVESHGWLHYCGTHWKAAGAEAKLERAIVSALKQKQQAAVDAELHKVNKAAVPSAKNVRAAKFLFRSMVTHQIEEFDRDYDLLNVANGAIHLPTGELQKHSPEQSFTYCLKTSYHPDKTYEGWEAFLEEVVEVPEMVEYLQRCVGYGLTGYNSEEVLWYIYGPTRSGKGTFTETLQALMGTPLCAEVQFGTFTRDRDNDANNFDLAPLKPCRLIFASESKKNQRLNDSAVKWLTGGNRIRCSFKRKDHFEYNPQYKCWLTSNYPVRADVDDDAVWGRIRYLRFPNSRLGQEDKGLKERMKSSENLERVLVWAVEGARRWYETRGQGLKTPGIVQELTQQCRDEQDYVKQWIEDCIVVNSKRPGAYLTNPTLYQDYTDWCEQNGVRPKGKTGLTQALNSKGIDGPIPKRVGPEKKPARVWLGLDLRADLVSDEETDVDENETTDPEQLKLTWKSELSVTSVTGVYGA